MNIVARFESLQHEILCLLAGAKRSVRICVAWINGEIYGPVLRDLASRGVLVQIICTADATNRNTAVHFPPSVAVHVVQPTVKNAYMHNKFCIVDEELVITGSYNWSRKAPLSFENIVVIRGRLELVKSFLHEFYDLLEFSVAPAERLPRCLKCTSLQFTVGVFGPEEDDEGSKLEIWSVCCANSHVVHWGTQREAFSAAQLGDDDVDGEDVNTRDPLVMLRTFEEERARMRAVQNYLSKVRKRPVHAYGWVEMENSHQHLKLGVPPEYSLVLHWRDMRFRKLIPRHLYSGEGDVDQILDGPSLPWLRR